MQISSPFFQPICYLPKTIAKCPSHVSCCMTYQFLYKYRIIDEVFAATSDHSEALSDCPEKPSPDVGDGSFSQERLVELLQVEDKKCYLKEKARWCVAAIVGGSNCAIAFWS